MNVPFETRRVDLGRRTVVVDHRAGAAPLVALHGIPGWRGTWRKVADRLPQHQGIVLPDLPGFGASSPAPRDAHAPEYAALVLQTLDRLGIERFHLAGFDFGGPISLLLCRLAPSRVRSLSLLATNALRDTPVPLPLRIARVPIAGDLAFRVLFGRTGLALTWVAATGDKSAFPFREYRRSLAPREGVASTRRIFLRSLRHLDRLYAPVEEALRHLAVPVQVLWGDRDPFFPVSIGERTARAVPGGAAFHVLRGAGHFLPEERAAEVAARIAEHAAERR